MEKKKTDSALSFFVVLALTLTLISGAIFLNQVFSFQATLNNSTFSTSASTEKVAAIADPPPNATSSPTPTPSPSATPSPSPTTSPTPTPPASPTPKPTPSQTPNPTPTPKATPTPSPSPMPSTPSATPTPSPTIDQTPVTPNPNALVTNSEYGTSAYYWATLIAAFTIVFVVAATAALKKKQNK